MPNLGSVLKQEIARIARREMKSQIVAARKASAQHRKHIAALRRQIETLERRLAGLVSSPQAAAAAPADAAPEARMRFAPKGLRSLRARLGLSAERFGKLIGVTAQSIYNWEHRVTTPRAPQLQVIASMRSIGKREALARLEAMDATPAEGGAPRRKRTARQEKR